MALDFLPQAPFVYKTASELAAAPSAADIAAGDRTFYDIAAHQTPYRMNAGRTAFVTVGAVSGAGKSIGFGRSLIPFGDSITGNGMSLSPGVPGNSNARAWYYWGNAFAGGGYDIPYVAGYAGYNSGQLAALFQADVIARAPSACSILCGTNDSVTATETIAKLQEMYTAAIAAGIYVYACTILPRPATSTAQKNYILAINAWIAEFWRTRIGSGECIDMHATVADPLSTIHGILAGMFAAGDDVHPSNKGAQAMGRALGAAFVRQGVPKYPLVASANDDRNIFSGANQLIKNPMGTGSVAVSGMPGASGNLPTSWTVYCVNATVVCSMEARTDGIGFNVVLSITFSAAGSLGLYFGGATAPTAGMRWRMAFAYKIDAGAVNLASIGNSFYPGGPSSGTAGNIANGTIVGGDPEQILVAPLSFTDSPADTPYAPSVLITSSGAGNAVIRIGRPTLREFA